MSNGTTGIQLTEVSNIMNVQTNTQTTPDEQDSVISSDDEFGESINDIEESVEKEESKEEFVVKIEGWGMLRVL